MKPAPGVRTNLAWARVASNVVITVTKGCFNL